MAQKGQSPCAIFVKKGTVPFSTFASLLGMADKVDRCDVWEGFPFYPLAAYLANLLTATIDDSTYECLWGIGRMCLANKFIAHTGFMDKADVKRVGPVGFKE